MINSLQRQRKISNSLDDFPSYLESQSARKPTIVREIEKIYNAKGRPIAGNATITIDNDDLRVLLTTLFFTALYFEPNAVVQTGTFMGTSSVAIALALQENDCGELYTIDPEPPEYFGVGNPVDVARRVIGDSSLKELVHFIKGYSTVPLDNERQELVQADMWRLNYIAAKVTFDMLVIDGDHTRLGCYLDLLHGAPALNAGGPRIIAVHDYLGIPDVRDAVDTWRENNYSSSRMEIIPGDCGIALIQL